MQQENTQNVEEVEIIEDVNVQETTEVETIEMLSSADAMAKTTELKKRFDNFIVQSDKNQSKLTTDVSIEELESMGAAILEAQNYLSGFADKSKQTLKSKVYQSVTGIKLLGIGDYAKKELEEYEENQLKKAGVDDVIDEMFKKMDEKKERLIELADIIDKIKKKLIEDDEALDSYLVEIRTLMDSTTETGITLRLIDMSNTASRNQLVLKDQAYTKIDIIQELMGDIINNMTNTLPSLKHQLKTETKIAGFLQAVADAAATTRQLEELTQSIVETSTENVQTLILTNSNDISNKSLEFYEKSAERNEDFNKKLIASKKKIIEHKVETFNRLDAIQIDSSKQLAARASSEKDTLKLAFKKYAN